MSDPKSYSECRPGNIVEKRYVDPNDLKRWEEQRRIRKSKRVILDPHRYDY